ncbi:MAG TPA: FtsQ-type POTRA domain-containing protein [Bryobacteraceae bacterium]|nr:FtsQ-type POTRA domain-containing protein [Bryobacteraceae bacterium]
MAREAKKNNPATRKLLWRGGLILLGIGAGTGIAVHLVHRYLIHDPKFVLSHERRDALAIEGLRYGSRAKVQRIFAEDADHSVFAVPLEERRRRLLAIDWVEDAAVSRIWPDRLSVRIQERKPLAFVEVQGTVLLIDAQGMLLEPPPQSQFSFPVLSGVRAEDPPERRTDAVRALLDVQDALGASMKNVSEVNAADPGNIRVVVQVDGRVVDLILGGENLGSRYRNFLKHYPEIHRRSPQVRVFDLRLDDRITARE